MLKVSKLNYLNYDWLFLFVVFSLPFLVNLGFLSLDKNAIMIFYNETLSHSYWWSFFYSKAYHESGTVFWNPYMTLGFPAGGYVLNTALYPLYWPLRWLFNNNPLDYLRNYNIYILIHYALSGVFCYGLLRKLKILPVAAFFGAIMYEFNPVALMEVSGYEWIYGFTWFPAAVYFLILAKEENQWYHWLGLSVVIGFVLSTSFIPIIYYFSIILFVYAIFLFRNQWRRPKFILPVFFVIILASSFAAPTLFPLLEFLTGGLNRTYTNWSFVFDGTKEGIAIFWSLIWPVPNPIVLSSYYQSMVLYFMGYLALLNSYFRTNYFKENVALAIFLILFGSGHTIYFGDLLYYVLPGYSIQHQHYRIQLFLGLPLVIIAASVFNQLLKIDDNQLNIINNKNFFIFLTIIVVAAIYLLLKDYDFFELRVVLLIFLVVAVTVIMFFLRKTSKPLLAIILILAAFTEVMFVWDVRSNANNVGYLRDYKHFARGSKYIYNEEGDWKERYFVGNRLKNDTSQYILFNQAMIRGWSTPEMRKPTRFFLYGFIDSIFNGKPYKDLRNFQGDFINKNLKDISSFSKLVDGPRVFFVSQHEVLEKRNGETEDAYELRILKRMAETDLSKTAILTKNIGETCSALTSKAKIKILNFSVNGFEAKVNNLENCPLILIWVDNYYPGWKSWVDNKESKITEVDYMFKSILIQPGEHYIRFNFIPTNYNIYKNMHRLSLLFIVGGVFFYVGKRMSRRKIRSVSDNSV